MDAFLKISISMEHYHGKDKVMHNPMSVATKDFVLVLENQFRDNWEEFINFDLM